MAINQHPKVMSFPMKMVERDLQLTLDDAAFDQLIDAGFDPIYGARPLKRAIQQQVENGLAQRILAGDYVPGDTILVTAQNGELVFDKVKLS